MILFDAVIGLILVFLLFLFYSPLYMAPFNATMVVLHFLKAIIGIKFKQAFSRRPYRRYMAFRYIIDAFLILPACILFKVFMDVATLNLMIAGLVTILAELIVTLVNIRTLKTELTEVIDDFKGCRIMTVERNDKLVSLQTRVTDTVKTVTKGEKNEFEALIKAGGKTIDHKLLYFEGERLAVDKSKIDKAYFPRISKDKVTHID